MNLPHIKNGWIITICVLLFLMIFNPSKQDFEEYNGVMYKGSLHRVGYFFVCSVYEYGDEYYLGVAKNFINITRHTQVASIQPRCDSTSVDSTKMDSAPTSTDPLGIVNQIYKTKDGQVVTQEQLLYSGYSQDRIKKGIEKGILIPYFKYKK